ncbi:uncharacterized protein LOC120643755 isoform X2 [Panicum virgatum]|uniref:uncharacterized protein LOC120643755 isoform X2 n=1 Tax=Panicum virgatum TaxID=38727 RepID=UPI0019D53892|nr:uncharacterized protein LOC120643755 isoform X2 [Panicum virgatum]
MPPLVGSPPPTRPNGRRRTPSATARVKDTSSPDSCLPSQDLRRPLAPRPPPHPVLAVASRPSPRHGKELAPAGALASPLALGGLGSIARTISSCLRPPWHAAGAAPACSRLLIGVAWGHTPARTWPPAASLAGRGRHPRYTAAFHSDIPVLWCMFGEEEIQEGLNLEAEFLL